MALCCLFWQSKMAGLVLQNVEGRERVRKKLLGISTVCGSLFTKVLAYLECVKEE